LAGGRCARLGKLSARSAWQAPRAARSTRTLDRMQAKILYFWLTVWGLLFLLKIFPSSAASQLAFTWFGPTPRPDETWARFQFRWAGYSFWWLTQIAVVFSLVLAVSYYLEADDSAYFLLATFALGLGGATAAVATLWFVLVALKHVAIGPNPSFQPDPPTQ